MARTYRVYLGIALCAPMLFWAYLHLGLVCAPRAVIFQVATGALSVLALSAAHKWRKTVLYLLAALVPCFVIVSTPIIMISRLGWEKFVGQRLIAYSSFEGIAIVQLFLIAALVGMRHRNSTYAKQVAGPAK